MDEKEKAILTKIWSEVFSTTKGAEIKAQFEKDLIKCRSQSDFIGLYKKYEVYLTFGRSLGTIKNLFSDFRKIVTKNKSKIKHFDLVDNIFRLPEGYYYAINSTSQKVVEKRRKEGAKMTLSQAEFDKLLADLYRKGMDKNISFWRKPLGSRQTKEQIRSYYLSAYLALSTGRRLTEILKTLELKKYKDSIKAKGLLKKRGEANQQTVDLLILDDSQKVVSAWRELRKIFDTSNLTNREVNNKYNNIFNRFLKTNILPNATFHDLRSFYAEMAFLKFGKPQNFEKIDFIEFALNQEKSKIKAADFYLNKVKIKQK